MACRDNYHWPNFSMWAGLRKLDLQAWEVGGNYDAERINLRHIAHIPVIRLRSNSAMYLTVPEEAEWEHLCLECYSIMDLEFEDVTSFGKVSRKVLVRCCLAPVMRSTLQSRLDVIELFKCMHIAQNDSKVCKDHIQI